MKFEFGDLYRFIVSLGVVVFSISILAPWLFLKESFDLFKTEAEIRATTQVAREVILNRQETVSIIVKLLPVLTVIGCALGLSLIIYGLCKWRHNQLLLDEMTIIDAAIKRQSFRDATQDEVEDSHENEVRSTDANAEEAYKKHANFMYSTHGEISHHYAETLVLKRLHGLGLSGYFIEPNQIVGGTEIDVLLRARNKFKTDCIIEVKSIRRGFNFGWLRESFLKNIYAKNIYAQITGRMPNTLLLIITDFSLTPSDKYSALQKRVASELLARDGKDRVVILNKNEFSEMPPEQLQASLGI